MRLIRAVRGRVAARQLPYAVIIQIFYAFGLLAGCVIIHAVTLTRLLRHLRNHPGVTADRFLPSVWLLIQLAWWLVLAHLVEIMLWAAFYGWMEIFPTPEAPFYFSAVTYTTVGYGDLVPPSEWRLLAGVEGLTGILMCGWSTGFVFAAFSRILKSTRSPDASD